MAYYWNVMTLCVGAAFCFMLGQAVFEDTRPAPAVTQVKPPPPSPVRHADAGNLPRK
ncbi:hypothetical protein OV207_09255 [Corallococcus sp. BB11-1]|uniref:hypothetical protein n=1 Tax=Corallococcus sp. BB11-1 TaxID=2996783 RepID=UPI00226F5E6C|nr:hypothetical protein [Corallococcus sp. BB11-1]MCY1031638.1 hypothetical protein [Corallococcus sp. BB11-1]